MGFFYPQANVEHVFKRIFAHDLLKCETVCAGLSKSNRLAGDLVSMLKYIIHALTQPSLFVACQRYVNLLGSLCFTRSLDIQIQPDVIEVVCISVPDDDEKIIGETCPRC